MKNQTPVNSLSRINSLIDAASASAGGQNKLAEEIGWPKGTISNWRSGRDTCPPEAQALMADIAGLDAAAVFALATLEKHAGTPRGDKLENVLGKLSRAGRGAASLLTFAAAVWGLMTPPSEARAALHDV